MNSVQLLETTNDARFQEGIEDTVDKLLEVHGLFAGAEERL